MQDKLREIRTQLRMAMNGVISTSMREKGIVYKLNFGVPLAEIKQIAAMHQPDDELAAALWKEDIREFKILATLLQPTHSFTKEQAKAWVKEIPYLEIAEQCSRNLFSKLPVAEDLAVVLIFNADDEYARTVAFLIWSHLYMEGHQSLPPCITAFMTEAECTLGNAAFGATWKEKQAALKALKSYGRQSKKQSVEVLARFDFLREAGTPEQQEFYNDLKFEFEYYH